MSTREVVGTIWAAELGVLMGPDDHFFRSGGTSFNAARATASVGTKLSLDVKLAVLFEKPVVRDYAAALDQLAGNTRSLPGRLVRIDRNGPIPLSYQQESRLERERNALGEGR